MAKYICGVSIIPISTTLTPAERMPSVRALARGSLCVLMSRPTHSDLDSA